MVSMQVVNNTFSHRSIVISYISNPDNKVRVNRDLKAKSQNTKED